MRIKPEELYLDLLKKSLSFTLWPEPPIPITTMNFQRSFIKRTMLAIVSQVLDKYRLQLVKNRSFFTYQRTEGQMWPSYAHTMIGLKRLDNLQYCITKVIEQGINGDFIETGVWRGGACIFMRGILAAFGIEHRRVFVADSFEGLPKPDAANYPSDKGDKHYAQRFLSVSIEEVRKNFEKYGLLDKQVVFLKGWFKDTLPNAPIENLSILRIDGDMYGSTMDALNNLYPQLSIGGFCIIDDYALKGCENAVDDYRAKYHINQELKEIDWTARYWIKE